MISSSGSSSIRFFNASQICPLPRLLPQFLDQFGLELLAGEQLQRLLLAYLAADPQLPPLDDLPHLVLDGLQFTLGEGAASGQDEIVISAVLDLRPDRVLDLAAVQLDHRLGKNMSQGMPVNAQIQFLIHN